MHVCNDHRYGYMNVAVKAHQGLEEEKANFIHLILEALGEDWGPPPSHNAPFLGIDLSMFGCQPCSELVSWH